MTRELWMRNACGWFKDRFLIRKTTSIPRWKDRKPIFWPKNRGKLSKNDYLTRDLEMFHSDNNSISWSVSTRDISAFWKLFHFLHGYTAWIGNCGREMHVDVLRIVFWYGRQKQHRAARPRADILTATRQKSTTQEWLSDSKSENVSHWKSLNTLTILRIFGICFIFLPDKLHD